MLIRDAYKQMLLSPETRIRNTALMMDEPGTPPGGKRVRATPMTKRSDSADLNLKHGTDPAKTAYYFYGTKQDNEQEDGLDTLGTIEGDGTIVIRGKDPTSGALRSHEDIVGTLVHETSHIIVKDYGEHPKTATDARQLRPLQGRVPRVLHRAALLVLGHERGRPRGRDPRAPVRQDRGHGQLLGPRQRVLGDAARHEPVPQATCSRTSGRTASTSTTARTSTGSCTCCARRRRARSRSRSRCSRSASSPPPSAPRRPARR